MIKPASTVFDWLETRWETHLSAKVVSSLLLLTFLLGLLFVFSVRSGWLTLPGDVPNYYLAIDAAFQVLLITEILGLIFVLPRSVADSVGKQFEILSIILLRSAFKEFGGLEQPLEWTVGLYEPLFHMLSDAFGALVIFAIIGFYYRRQKHERITRSELEQERFIGFKKLIAMLLLICFLLLGLQDISHFVLVGKYDPSLNFFYTLLIFTDILILLYSLRYSTKYTNLFRYSSFALATILIRISLTAPPYLNVALGIAAGLFILGLTYMYNYFISQENTG